MFEFTTLTWQVELWGFEPLTSCMPSPGSPSGYVQPRVTVLSSASESALARAGCGTSVLYPLPDCGERFG